MNLAPAPSANAPGTTGVSNEPPGVDGERCPYLAEAPVTDAGWAAWDTLLRCAGQLRVAANGVVLGLDLGTVLSLGVALGHSPQHLAELVPAAEAGLVDGLHNRLTNLSV